MGAGERWENSRRSDRAPEAARPARERDTLPERGSDEWNEALDQSFTRLEHRLNSLAKALDDPSASFDAPPPRQERAPAPRAEREQPRPSTERERPRPSIERERPIATAPEPRERATESDYAQRLDAALAEISARQRVLAEPPAAAAPPEPPSAAEGAWRLPTPAPTHHEFARVRDKLARGSEHDALSRLDDRYANLSGEMAGLGARAGSTTVREAIAAKRAAESGRPSSEPVRNQGIAGRPPAGGSDLDVRLNRLVDELSRHTRALQSVDSAASERATAVDGKLTSLTRSVHDLGSRIDKVTVGSGNGLGPEAQRELRTALQDIRARIALVSAGDNAGQQGIREAIEKVSGRLEQLPATGGANYGMDRIQRELTAIGERMIEQVRSEIQKSGRGDSHDRVMREAVERLAARLERAEARSHFDPAEMAEVTAERVVARLDHTGSATALSRLERGMADILRQIEDGRALSSEAAEATASRAVHTTLAALSGAGLPDFSEVTRELAKLRASSDDNQRLTIDALVGVRDALTRVTERLALNEAGATALVDEAASTHEDDGDDQALTMTERARAAAHTAVDEAKAGGTFAPIFRAAVDGAPGSSDASQERAQLIAAARRSLLESETERLRSGDSIEAERHLHEPLAPAGANDNIVGGGGLRRVAIGLAAALVLAGSWQIARVLLTKPDAQPQLAAADSAPPASAPAEKTALAAPPTGDTAAHASATAGTPRVVTADNITASPATADATTAPETAPPATVPVEAPKTAAGTADRSPTPDPAATASLPPIPIPAAPNGIAAIPGSATTGTETGTLPAAIGSAQLRADALEGKPAAQYEIGLRYFQGHGVTQDATAAAKWFALAARQNLAPAAFRLGALFEKGTGVDKAPAAARKWYEQAADAGNVRAMHNLGVLYANGVLGKPDFASAARWFRRAADHGLKDSQYNLGVLYARGLAVKQNLSEAYLWFSLAADQGDKDAAHKRDDIAAKLGKQQLVTARLAAGTWHAKAPITAANEVSPPPGGWDDHAAAKAGPSASHHH